MLSTSWLAAQPVASHLALTPPSDGLTAAAPAAPTDSPVLDYAERMPAFAGGDNALHQYLKRTIKFPAEALARRLSGTVVVQFVVDEQGRVLDPTVVRSSQALFDDEAIRLARLMPWWEPGRHQGNSARVRCTLPIIFTAR